MVQVRQEIRIAVVGVLNGNSVAMFVAQLISELTLGARGSTAHQAPCLRVPMSLYDASTNWSTGVPPSCGRRSEALDLAIPLRCSWTCLKRRPDGMTIVEELESDIVRALDRVVVELSAQRV